MALIIKKKSFKKKLADFIKKKKWSLLISITLIIITIWWGTTFFQDMIESYVYFKVLGDNHERMSRNIGYTSNDFLTPVRNWDQEEITLEAQAVLVTEYDKKRKNLKKLWKKNSQYQLPIASLSKLMTAIVAIDHYDLDRLVNINQEMIKATGSSGLLNPGEILSVKDLLFLSLIESSNDACKALSEVSKGSFIKWMNKKATEIGLEKTIFINSSGLNNSHQQTNYSTAKDLQKIVKYIIDNPKYQLILDIIAYENFDLYMPNGVFHHTLNTTNDLLSGYENMIGGKTGYLPNSGGSFIGLFKKPTTERYLFVIILNSPDRFGETRRILEWLPKAYLYLYNYGH